jgi:hypothetical protein
MAANQTIQWQKRQVKKRQRRVRRLQKRGKKNMSDAARLYRVVLRHLLKLISPDMLAENCITLAMLITGILRSRSGQLKKIARAVQYAYKKESLVERFRRFVRNENIEVEVEYTPFNGKILKAVGQGPIILMVDSTKMGGRCICLMLSVYYKSRALPFAWLTFKGRKGHSSQATQLELFKRVKALLPENVPVILLGDGEFDGSEVVEWFETEAKWQYVCRTDHSNLIFYQGRWIALDQLPFKPGQEAFLEKVLFTKANQIGPVNILVVWHETKECHWFFVTNVETATEAKAWYTKRFTTETLFSDFKSRGFNLDDTGLWHPERVNRLVFAGSIAYFFTVVLGVKSIVSGAFRQLVRTDAFYHSLFQLGLIYLDHLLNECLDFPSLLDLPPPDTFEHVVISA